MPLKLLFTVSLESTFTKTENCLNRIFKMKEVISRPNKSKNQNYPNELYSTKRVFSSASDYPGVLFSLRFCLFSWHRRYSLRDRIGSPKYFLSWSLKYTLIIGVIKWNSFESFCVDIITLWQLKKKNEELMQRKPTYTHWTIQMTLLDSTFVGNLQLKLNNVYIFL